MNVSNRMQKIRLEVHNQTESINRNLAGSHAKSDTVGSINHEVKSIRRDMMLLMEELKDNECRK